MSYEFAPDESAFDELFLVVCGFRALAKAQGYEVVDRPAAGHWHYNYVDDQDWRYRLGFHLYATDDVHFPQYDTNPPRLPIANITVASSLSDIEATAYYTMRKDGSVSHAGKVIDGGQVISEVNMPVMPEADVRRISERLQTYV